MAFDFIELFAGVGGLGDAMGWLGGRCVLAAEIDDDAQQALLDRHPELATDAAIGDVLTLTRHADGTPKTIEEIAAGLPDAQVVCGGPPCQDFSKSGAQAGADGARGSLTAEFLRVVEAVAPDMVVMENVRNLVGRRHRGTYDQIVAHLDGLGYDVHEPDGDPLIASPHQLAPDAGGSPQYRTRLFLVAVRRGSDLDRLLGDARVDLTSIADAYGFDPSGWQVDDLLEADDQIADLDHYRIPAHHQTWIDAWQELLRALPVDQLPAELWVDGFVADLGPVLAAHEVHLPSKEHKRRKLELSHRLYLQHRAVIDPWLAKPRGPVNAAGDRGTVADFPATRRILEWQARTAQPTRDQRNLWGCSIQLRSSGIRVKPLTYLPALVAINNAPIIGPRRRVLTPREAWRLQSLPVPVWSAHTTAGTIRPDRDVAAVTALHTAPTDVGGPVMAPRIDVDAAGTVIASIVDRWAADGVATTDAVALALHGAPLAGLTAGELLVAAAARATCDTRLNRPGVATPRLLWDTYRHLADGRHPVADDPALACVDWRVLTRMQAAAGRNAGQTTTAAARQHGAATLPTALPSSDLAGRWATLARQVRDAAEAGWPLDWAVALVRSRLLSVADLQPQGWTLADIADLTDALVAEGLVAYDPTPGPGKGDVDYSDAADALDHIRMRGDVDLTSATLQMAGGHPPTHWVPEVSDAAAARLTAAAAEAYEQVIDQQDGIDWFETDDDPSIAQLHHELLVADTHVLHVAGVQSVPVMVRLAAYERLRQAVDVAGMTYGFLDTDTTAEILAPWDIRDATGAIDAVWALVHDAAAAASAAASDRSGSTVATRTLTKVA